MLVSETIEIDLDLVDIDSEKNPRRGRGFETEGIEELAARIYSEGQLTPITIRKKPGGRYDLVAGERRVRAARVIGWKTLRAEVLAPGVSAEQAAVLAHIENLDRVDLSEYDRAVAAKTLIDAQKTSLRAYAERVGVPYETLKRHVGWIRTLPQAILAGWRDGDPRATPKELERLSRMMTDEAEMEWDKLAAPKMPELQESAKPRVKKPKRPGPRQLEALMERVEKTELDPEIKELATQIIEYAQGARREPPRLLRLKKPEKGK